jgi:sulfate adenylyltransferase subunit 2
MGRKNQRPELFVERKNRNGQNVRVFNFELDRLDVWSYIEQEQLKFHRFIFHTKRKVFLRDGMIWSHSPFVPRRKRRN